MDNHFEDDQMNDTEEQAAQKTSAEEPQKEYKDPNEDVFQSGVNPGTAQGYHYGASYQEMQQPSNVSVVVSEDRSPLSMGEWLLTLLIAMVPCIGLVVYLVWAFDHSGNVNRKNFCRAYLILHVISIVLVMVMMIFMLFFNIVA